VLTTGASLVVAGRMAALAATKDRAASSEREANRTAQAALKRADASRLEVEAQRDRAERNLYVARIGQAESSLRLFDSATARALLDQCIPESGGPDRRGWEWSYLDRWCRPELRTLTLPTSVDTHVVAVSPDGRFLAVGCARVFPAQTGEHSPVPTYVIDLKNGKVRHELTGHRDWVYAVAFRPDGKRFATAGGEKTIKVWDSDTGREPRNLNGLAQPVHSLDWSPDGRRLASADEVGLVRIWDPETGHETGRISHPGARAAWSPDGTRIATGGGDQVRIWAAADGQPSGPVLSLSGEVLVLRSFGPPPGSGGWTPRLAFSADGSRIAAHLANYLNLWEAGPLLDPQVEPTPDDVAGWLRRSRSFATHGDDIRAVAAFERALAIPTDLPEPWIRHGLAEGIEPRQAEMAFTRALEVKCDDPIRLLVCARELVRSDRKHEAGIALTRARVSAEKRLSVAPDDEPAAWVMADLLKDGLATLRDGSWAIPQDTRFKKCTPGRFRLSVTNGPVTLFETVLHKTLTEPEWNGRTRLGVVYYLREDWQAAAAALRTAADAPEATGTDRFLLALAFHHLDRHDEARRFLESGIGWLKQNKAGGTLRTVAVEAIAEIDRISRVQADARMFLDPIFPRNPFARLPQNRFENDK